MHLFVAVATAGGFRAAAETLGIPRSTLSRRISELERDVGVRLFSRSTRHVELTESGRVYFERCAKIVAEAQIAHHELSEQVSNFEGMIRVAIPHDFSVTYLGGVLADFAHLHPLIQFEVGAAPHGGRVSGSQFDVIIRVGMPAEQHLLVRKLADVALGLYASPSYLGAKGIPATPPDLQDHNCIRAFDRAWVFDSEAQGVAQSVAVSGSFTTNDLGLIRRLALNDIGIVSLPHFMVVDDVAAARLIPVLPDWSRAPISIYALTETRMLPAKVRGFLDFLAQHIPKTSPIAADC